MDRGLPAFGGSVYFLSTHKTSKERKSMIAASKSEVSKRTVPANEALARPLGMDIVIKIVECLVVDPEVQLRPIEIILYGDSSCVAALFNPDIQGTVKKRLFDIMTTVANPVNSQFPNYCERNTYIIKKWMRQATMIGRKVTFPVLNRVEWEYILEKSCREINSIPIARGQEFALLSPASMIYPAEYEDLSIPTTTSNMVNVNRMFNRI